MLPVLEKYEFQKVKHGCIILTKWTRPHIHIHILSWRQFVYQAISLAPLFHPSVVMSQYIHVCIYAQAHTHTHMYSQFIWYSII
jgi:hypothetical protein